MLSDIEPEQQWYYDAEHQKIKQKGTNNVLGFQTIGDADFVTYEVDIGDNKTKWWFDMI